MSTIQEYEITGPKVEIEIKGAGAYPVGVGFNDKTNPVVWFKTFPADNPNFSFKAVVIGTRNGEPWPDEMEYCGTASRAAPMGVRTIHLFYRRLA